MVWRMDEADRRFAGNLRFYRERAGMTQADLAARMKEAGFDAFRQQTIARIESLGRRASLGEATALARSVGTTADALSRPHGLAREASHVLSAGREVMTIHAEIRDLARRFAQRQAGLRLVMDRIEREGHAAELATEMSVARRAAALSLAEVTGSKEDV
jgi:transcriptional regulator with XRE-family HTH domain